MQQKRACSERDVLAWWQRQPFDLALRSYEGNCDLCYLKGHGKITAILRDQPDLAGWWIAQEARPPRGSAKGVCPSLQFFRADREPYGYSPST